MSRRTQKKDSKSERSKDNVSNVKVEKSPKIVAPRTTKTPKKDPNYSKIYSLYNIWVASFFLKCLLFVSYHSTDFDVHRNWLAITHELPLSQWYIEATSQWTLDYPPYFAYFEWIMSQFIPQSVKLDGCLDLVEKGLYGWPTVLFQRSTVIVSELILFISLQWVINTSPKESQTSFFVIASSLVLSPGLLIVDHIHFQYNGMMFGFLIFMINSARLKKYLWCGFWFSLLLCFKHIFLYLAPSVFFFLLRSYCLNFNDFSFKKIMKNPKTILDLVQWVNLFKLSSIVILNFTLAFAPFVYTQQVPNVLERLFPFSRGLTHAYWAPNVWAVYSFIDRLLIQIIKYLPLSSFPKLHYLSLNNASSTRGIVGDIEFSILPDIKPFVTFLLTLFYQILSVLPILFNPSFERFVGSLTLCGFASFLFGWHVHEKAIMLVIIPFSFIVIKNKRLLNSFNLLVSCGYVSLFPLIFTSQEWLLKCLYTFVWCVIYFASFKEVTKNSNSNSNSKRIFFLDRLAIIFTLGLIPLVLFTSLLDILQIHFASLKNFQFLQLMCYSVYCAIGIISSWNGLSWLYFLDDSIWN